MHSDRSAGTADDAVNLAAETAPDVVVVDPRLPGIEGAALMPGSGPSPRLPRPRPQLVGNGDLTSGADSYVRKTFRPHELIDAVIATTRRSLA